MGLKRIFKKYLYIILAIILLIITFFLTPRKEGFDNEFRSFISDHKFIDENNNVIDHINIENTEQYQAYKYIKPEDVVLELGGRYGTVSVVINKIVNNKSGHVVVEPDENVINCLKTNLENHGSSCQVLPQFISNSNKKIIYNGYGTSTEYDESKSSNQITYEEFKKMYPQDFNVIVADCEGCVYDFLEMMGEDFNKLNKLIFEADKPDICDYSKVKDKLTNAGFKEVDNQDNFRFVYIKN
jgi:FkbM family methyltransferase